MHTIRYVDWQEGDWWLGYLKDYPDYWTQGETLADLIEHLKNLCLDLSGGQIPGARKVGELVAGADAFLKKPQRCRRVVVRWVSTSITLISGTPSRE